MAASDIYPPQLAVGVTSDRIRHASPAARTVHRHVLRSFANTGQAPSRDDLTREVGLSVVDAALRELHNADIIRLDDAGHVTVAYPFSARPTPHRVHIAHGPVVYAMCAIDALGMAAMLGRDITIHSTEPDTAAPVTVTIHDGRAGWVPDTAVAFVGGIGRAAPAADRCCTVMNFFTAAQAAQLWTGAHPEVTGTILNQAQAVRLGADIFRPLLAERDE